MHPEAQLVLIIGVCFCICALLVTDCDKHAQDEVTKRQYIAGTNAMPKAVWPYNN